MMARLYLALMTLAIAAGIFALLDGQSATANGEPHVVVVRTPAPPRYERARNMFVLDSIAEPEDKTPKGATLQDGAGLGDLGANGLQVIGVVISGDIRKAILGGPDGGELTIGQHVDAARTVVAITQDSVRLSDGSIIPVDPFTTSGSDSQSSPYLVPALVPTSGPAPVGAPTGAPVVIPQSGGIGPGALGPSGPQYGAPVTGQRGTMPQHPYSGGANQQTRPSAPYGGDTNAGQTPAPAPYATP